MTIKLRCRSCFAKVSADDDLIGKDVNCPNCNFQFTLPKPQFGFGKILGGYEIEQWLGSGAMGEVYLARQVSMNRPVALKVIKHDITMDREVVDRFAHEAQVLASLNHPYIVPAFDAGHTDECYYMAMGFVDGETLEDRLKRNGRMDETEVLNIATKVADALKYAWTEFKLLHRDIKPANIMIDNMKEVKIMDMGIAKNTTDDGGLTKVGLVVGTPFYMSPEQAQASTGIDFRSDVYALAASMYHLLTGTLPFQGPNVMAILAKKVNFPLVPANEINPDISQETSDFIAKLLSFKPDDRIDTFDELFEMLKKGKAAAKEAKSSKRLDDEKTVHMKVPDKVLEHIAKSKSNHKIPKQKKPQDKTKLLIVSLLLLCLVLGLSLALIGDKKGEGETGKESNTVEANSSGSSNSSAVNGFDDGNGKKKKKIERINSTADIPEFLEENTVLFWKASTESEQKEKLLNEGSSSYGPIGQISLREGLFTFRDDLLSNTLNIRESNEFSLTINFKAYNNLQKHVCIMALGTDQKNSDLILIQKNEEIFLIIRTIDKREELKIGRMGKLRTNIILTYKDGILAAYVNDRQTMKRKGFQINTEKWKNHNITFGAFKHGEKRFWRGSVYSFALLKKALSEEDVEKIMKMIAEGIRKMSPRKGKF